MIRSLRRAHGFWWMGLAVLLPVGLLLALWSRPPAVLPMPAEPAGWIAGGGGAGDIALEPAPILLSPTAEGDLLVTATEPNAPLAPGLFLYATDRDVAVGEPLPDGAEPLGRVVVGQSVPAPASAGARLALYSTLDKAVVGVGRSRGGGTS